MLVGDASALRRSCCSWRRTRSPCRPQPEDADPAAARAAASRRALGVDALPDAAQICSCNNVSKGAICAAIREQKLTAVGAVKALHQGRHRLRLVRPAGDRAAQDRAEARRRRGHQPPLRALRVQRARSCSTWSGSTGIKTFDDAARRARPGPRLRDLQAGRGVDPGVGLERARPRRRSTRPLQDTNDRFLANIQRDGTYSVVPRVAGGEITPDQLIALGAGRQEVRPLHQDHRRPAHRPVRRARRAAARHLARAGRRRLRVGPRLRQGAAHGEVLRRQHLVPLRRAGLGRHRDPAREPLQGPARAAQAQVGASRAARASAPRRRARTSASSPPRRARTSTSAATAA